jgi:hypothetical protein
MKVTTQVSTVLAENSSMIQLGIVYSCEVKFNQTFVNQSNQINVGHLS